MAIRWEQTISGLLRALRLETIRSKLLAFALLATLIPSISTAWVSYVQNKHSLTDKIAQELRGKGKEAANGAEYWIDQQLINIRIFAISPVVSGNVAGIPPEGDPTSTANPARKRLIDYLTSVLNRINDYQELMVVNGQGRILATSARKPQPFQPPPDWQTAIRGEKNVIGAPYWDQALGQPMMIVAMPIHDGTGRNLGALTGRLRLTSVDSIVRKLGEKVPGNLYLVTGDGNFVSASYGGSAEVMKQRIAPATLGRLRENAGSVVQYVNHAATEVVGTASPVVTPGWEVVTEMPTAEAYRQVIRLRNVTVLIVAGLLGGVGLIGYLLGLVIVRPLNRLTSGAAKVATGDLAVDLPVMGGGEVGYLTQVFNNMVARLREGREQLDAIHETLRTKNEELERLSVTDVLTGISNRRHLMQRLAEEQGRARRLGRGFSVLMMDVDFFKKYNDSFGHQAGDEVLARVGAVLRQTIRAVDCAARYGGEEFLVVLPDTGMDGAVEVAERIRTKVAGEEFEGGRITLSVGVAAFPEHGETSETVVGAADAALYRAKREGRDRVVRSGRRRTREVRDPKGEG